MIPVPARIVSMLVSFTAVTASVPVTEDSLPASVIGSGWDPAATFVRVITVVPEIMNFSGICRGMMTLTVPTGGPGRIS